MSRSTSVVKLCFGRSFRLVRPSEFSNVFAARRVLRGAHFALHVRASERSFARLGLVIPKKQAPTAILRNAIKRQAREAFRLRRASLPALDLVLRLTTAVTGQSLSLRRQWRAEIDQLFDQLDLRMAA